MFGALAGCGELPFDDATFEATIERAGVGVQASLKAFRAGAGAMRQPLLAEPGLSSMETAPRPLPLRAGSTEPEPLRLRTEQEFATPTHAMVGECLQRVVEFQDVAHGTEYLDRVAAMYTIALQAGDADQDYCATIELARWVAVAMAYDDVVRVADLKTRAERFERVRAEVGAPLGEVMGTTEFFHLRLEEIYGLMPPGLVRWIDGSAFLRSQVAKRIGEGRRVRMYTLTGHVMLRCMAGLRRWRRRSQRHAVEILDAFNHWDDIEVRVKGQVVRSGGHGFCGIGRKRLLNILQRRCESLGVQLAFETDVTDDKDHADADLIIASDGLNSRIRTRYAQTYKPDVDVRDCRFVWLGTSKLFEAFTFAFEKTEWGWFQAHAYRFDDETSTFIVEAPQAVWRAAGLESMEKEQSIAFCERLFASHLDGHALVSNASHWRSSSQWIQFPRVI